MASKAEEAIQNEKDQKSGKLYLNYCGLEDIPSDLLKMDWLVELYLNFNKIKEITNLQNLKNLKILYLVSNQIKKIENIETLKSLEIISLNFNSIERIENIGNLINLKTLELGQNKISQIENLGQLYKLKNLYLFSNTIHEINNLTNLSNLETLALNNNKIKEIKNLDCLLKLKNLYLGSNLIREIKNLNNQNLEKIRLNDNNISTIKNLSNLPNLKIVHLEKNPILYTRRLFELIQEPFMAELRLYGSKSIDQHIPTELFGSEYNYNCYNVLKGYLSSIKKGAYQLKELSIILIGNSTAGKTSLRYFLQESVFPPTNDFSTHGIEPSTWTPDYEVLKDFKNGENIKDIQFYIWDFGGQEYYHATHRLFFSKKAIYILLWEPRTNKQGFEKVLIKILNQNGEIEEREVSTEVFPYEYWLESIRHYATDPSESPILLVQNKIDEIDESNINQREYPDFSLLSNYNCDVLNISVKKAYESKLQGKEDAYFSVFLETLFKKTEKLSSTINYGGLWGEIKQLLQKSKNENIWSLEQFLEKIRKFDKDIDENGVLSYVLSLKANGNIIYVNESSLLQKYIFINPGWVTEMIYLILDYDVLNNNGEFDKKHVVRKVGTKFAEIFIELLIKFELIFDYVEVITFKEPIKNSSKTNNIIREISRVTELTTYIAPQYLPATLTSLAKLAELENRFDGFTKPDFILQFDKFMPRHIMLRFLVANGRNAVGKYYWKNGIAFTINKTNILVLADYDKKQFQVFTEDKYYFYYKIVFDQIIQLADNIKNLQVSLDSENFIYYSALKQEYSSGVFSGNTSIVSVMNKRVPLEKFRYFFEDLKHMKNVISTIHEPKIMETKVKLFISYAHVDEKMRKIFEERYLRSIQNHYSEDLEVWSDIKIKPAISWDKTIQKEINEANCILFFLSNAFLASNYIKDVEIKKAIERYKRKEQIIIPIYIEEIPKKLLPFSDKQYLPSIKPLKEWKPHNKGWVKIQEGLITIIDDIKSGNTDLYFS